MRYLRKMLKVTCCLVSGETMPCSVEPETIFSMAAPEITFYVVEEETMSSA